MIEILLQARQAMTVGLLDQAERLYWQAIEADPQNAMAVVGLAEVALERHDEPTAHLFAAKALELDPENVAGQRLASRTAEILQERGDPVPAVGTSLPARPQTVRVGSVAPEAPAPEAPAQPVAPASVAPAPLAPRRRPGLLRRLLGGR